MALSTKMELRQSQSLVMTPQLQQAIKLLQLSNLELSAFVEEELERNPLLERAEGEEPVGAAIAAEAGEAPATVDALEVEDATRTDTWLESGQAAGDPAQILDTDYDNVFPDSGPGDLGANGVSGADMGPQTGLDWSSVRAGAGMGGEGAPDLEAYVSEERTLRDHLTDQLHLAIGDPVRRMIGVHLIDMVDEAGYLTGDLAGLAERLGADLALVEDTLATLQTFDPAGVFARDLGECLALQLKEQNRFDPAIAALLDNLHLLAAHDMAALRKACGASAEDLADMIAEIKRLNPKPGLKFGSVTVQPVVPDVIVRARADGSWHIELNAETLPKVLVNRSYYTTVAKTATNPKDKGYLSDCLQTASWLVKSLDQRARTILKVAEEIVRQQDAFLTHGVQYLRPLNLRTVADAIGMHESTVSRVTSNKYMATARGIFELKYFFTSAIASSGAGEAHSSEAVRHRIRQLIEAETVDNVLSDDKIVARLRAEGIDIARRTVAKYREAMRIPSSVQRRRQKKLALQTGAA